MRAASGSAASRVNGRQSTPLMSHSTPSAWEREIPLVRARTGSSIEEGEEGEGDEKVEKEPGENNKPRGEWSEVGDEDDDDDEEEDGKEGPKLRQRAISSGEGPSSNPQQLNGTLPTIRLNSLPADSVTEPIKGKRSYFLLYREGKGRSSTDKSPAAKPRSQPNLPSLPEWKLTERLRQLMEAGPRRSFTKPYAAKTVFFFKDGDEYFTGLRVPVSKARFRTMDALLDTLNQGISLPFGVRRLHTPSGRTQVNSLEQLKHLGKYVASSSKVCRRPPPIEVMEERERGKQQRSQLAPPRPLASTFSGRAEGSIRGIAQSSRRTHANNLTFLPVQAKQMFFVLNGHPSRIYRALINPLKASARGRSLEQQGVEKEDHDLSSLLDEISRGLQVAIFRIYSFDGERLLTLRQLLEMKEARALAVPRNERPLINGQTHSDIFFQRSGTDIVLPSILNSTNSTASNTNTKSSRSSSSSKQRKLLKSSSSNLGESVGGGGETTMGNNIEKPTKDFNSSSSSRNGLSMLRLTRASPSLMSPLDEERENAKAPNFLGDEEAAPSPSTETATRLPHLKEGRLIPRRRAALLSRKRKGPAVALAKKKGTATQKTDNEDVSEQISTDVSSTVSLQKEGENDQYKQTQEITEGGYHPEEPWSGVRHAVVEPTDKLMIAARRSNSDSETTTTSKLDVGSNRRRVSIDELVFVREIEALKLNIVNASDGSENPVKEGHKGPPGQDMQDSQPEAGGEVIDGEHAPSTDRGEEGVEEIAVELEFKREEDRGDAIELVPERAVLSHEGGPDGLVKTDGLPVVTELGDDSEEKDSQIDEHEEEETEKVPVTPQFYSSADPRNHSASPFTYTITVVTGNRWAADTEADLHVIIYGERQLVSQKIYLRQEHVNWLQFDAQHRFRQNQADSFRVELPTHFGVIEKIVIGHENMGYGAGVFIDRVLITEEENLASAKAAAVAAAGTSLWHQNDPTKIGMASAGLKQYLFACSKWFDSGQVDGRVERTLKLTAYADLNPPPPLTPTNLSDEGSTQGNELEQELLTKGRWELLLLVGKPDRAGSTSGLAVVGYGTSGQSKTIGLYDSRISEKGESSALIQLDFGDIGELLKVRVEVDGAGAAPDLFLRRVEFKDLDSGERFTCMCGKWLKWWNTVGQGGQPFRELSAFHIGIEPLSVITYECKMHVMPSRIPAISNPLIHVEIYGDLGETGLLPVTIGDEEEETGDAWEVDFKLEASSVGRVYGARIYFQPTKLGAEIYEGFITLSDIFKKHALEFPESAGNWLVSWIVLRESRHAPYRYLLRQSRVGSAQSSYNHAMTILVKEVLASEMEGVSTKAGKKKGRKRQTPSSYILSMLVGEGSTHYPDVTLCGKKGNYPMMTILNPTPSDGIISYQLKSAKTGELTKVRVSGNQSNRLALEAGDELKSQKLGTITTIHKIRLCDTANGDELRFPSADVELAPDSIYEFAAIWPDCPPTPIVNYSIKVPIVHSSVAHWNDSRVKINLHGEAGSTGFRLLNTATRTNTAHEGALPEKASTDTFEFEAVSVEEILKVEALIDPLKGRETTKVELGDIVVVDGTTTTEFNFKFDRPLTSSRAVQSSERQLAN